MFSKVEHILRDRKVDSIELGVGELILLLYDAIQGCLDFEKLRRSI